MFEQGIKTGLSGPDLFMNAGFLPRTVNLIAGRPGMGLTSLALTIAMNAATEGKTIAYYSLRDSRTELANRIVQASMELVRPSFELSGREACESLGSMLGNLLRLPIYIDDRSDLTPIKLWERYESFGKALVRPDLVIVDTFGRLLGNWHDETGKTKAAEISRALDDFAKKHDVPVLIVDQVPLNVEFRDDKMPVLSDIAYTELDKIASNVIFIHRPFYYKVDELIEDCDDDDPPEIPRFQDVQLILAKCPDTDIPIEFDVKWDRELKIFYEENR